MRPNTHPLIALLLFLFIFHTNLFATTRPKKIDPIRFTITTDASYLSTNEEFEIKITAKYLSINPNLVYVFDGANAFKLKLIVPDGFKQTGGNYSDFVGAELTSTKPSITYTVKGKFTSDTPGGTFQLLRSHRSAGNQSEFVQVGVLAFTTLSSPTDTLTTANARIAVVSPRYIPYMSLSDFRAGAADSSNVIYINEGGKSGIFQFRETDTSTPDDTSMVLVHGPRRYFREDLGYLRPEWWGAVADDSGDDAAAIQKMFNSITSKGAEIRLSAGEYLIGRQVNFHSPTGAPGWKYKVNMVGAGIQTTRISGKLDYFGDMFVINTGPASGSQKENYIQISNIYFTANNSKRIIYGTELVDVRIYDCSFHGGSECGIQIGNIDSTFGGYNCKFKNTYHIGAKYGEVSQIPALVKLYGVRFFLIENFESDGGYYGIDLTGDKNLIINPKIEGTKRAGIHITNPKGGGGENVIRGGTINPYGGLDRAGLYDGEMSCIEINSMTNGNSTNEISGVLLLTPSPGDLPSAFTISEIAGTFNGFAYLGEYAVVGSTSGAIGYVEGYNAVAHRLNVKTVTGIFQVGEVLTQAHTHASATLTAINPSHSYGIKTTGIDGYSKIINNRFRVGGEYNIYNATPGNLISGNSFETKNTAVFTNKANTTIEGNSFYVPGGVAVNNAAGVEDVIYSNNTILAGTLTGVKETYLRASGGEMSGSTTFSGNNTFSATNTFSGSTTSVTNLRLGGDALPLTTDIINIGSANKVFNFLYAYKHIGTIFQALNSSGLVLATTDGSQYARMANATGNFILGPGNPADDGKNFQVKGTSSFSGNITVNNLPVYADNTAASSGGLAVGALYRTSTGDIKVRY